VVASQVSGKIEFRHFPGKIRFPLSGEAGLRMKCGQISRYLAVAVGLLICGGCSKNDGPTRYDVHGMVEFDGIPLTMGRITFVPDSSKKNEGPVGYAMIEDGKYDTAKIGGKGTIAGPLKVLVTGFAPPIAGQETNEPIFEDYELTAELSKGQGRTELNFEVPLSARKKGK